MNSLRSITPIRSSDGFHASLYVITACEWNFVLVVPKVKLYHDEFGSRMLAISGAFFIAKMSDLRALRNFPAFQSW